CSIVLVLALGGTLPAGPGILSSAARPAAGSSGTTNAYAHDGAEGSVSLINFRSRRVTAKWWIPGGGSPDMGNVSADGKVLWLSGRYNNVVYAISTIDGHVIAKVPVPNSPHGLCVWPQPGRYSTGHTGVMR
ncbi:MAG TPA: hypothetical protein VED59_01730, partial [Acidimicrobiales bacterium]|nr:hypothetical protein [Acidimicrobiales bacterium]